MWTIEEIVVKRATEAGRASYFESEVEEVRIRLKELGIEERPFRLYPISGKNRKGILEFGITDEEYNLWRKNENHTLNYLVNQIF